MNLLKQRKEKKKKKPDFLRQEWFRSVSFGKKWRRPRGKQSKLRQHIKERGFIPNPGYGSPEAVRSLHPCGLQEVLVFNLSQIENIDAKKECARIGGTVGRRKRIEIMKIAKEMGVKVLNPQRTAAMEKKEKIKEEAKAKEKTKEEVKKEGKKETKKEGKKHKKEELKTEDGLKEESEKE